MKSFKESLLFEISLTDHFNTYMVQKYPNLTEEMYNKIAKFDPTSKNGQRGKYVEWLVRLLDTACKALHYEYEYLLSKWGFLDDEVRKGCTAEKLFQALQRHDKSPQKEDINKFKVIGPFFEYVDDLPPTAREQKMIDKDIFENDKDITIITNTDNWIIARPRTWEGNKKLARYKSKGADWCTARSDNPIGWNDYNSDGLLFVFINKHNPNEKYQAYYSFEFDRFYEIKDFDNESIKKDNIVYKVMREPTFRAYCRGNNFKLPFATVNEENNSLLYGFLR
jgi:hypothetical protein